MPVVLTLPRCLDLLSLLAPAHGVLSVLARVMLCAVTQLSHENAWHWKQYKLCTLLLSQFLHFTPVELHSLIAHISSKLLMRKLVGQFTRFPLLGTREAKNSVNMATVLDLRMWSCTQNRILIHEDRLAKLLYPWLKAERQIGFRDQNTSNNGALWYKDTVFIRLLVLSNHERVDMLSYVSQF